jgi:MFS family permease
MHPKRVLYIGNFFSAMHFFLIVYVISPYLATFLPDTQTGLVIAAGAIGTLAAFPFMPHITKRYGARKTAVVLSSIIAVALMVLAGQPPFWLAAFCVALACAASPFIQYLLDLLLEAVSGAQGEIARIRAIFITAGNVALILAPLLISFLLDGTEEYWRIFLAAALSLTPFITLLLFEQLPETPPTHHARIIESCMCLWRARDVRAVIWSNFVLQFFYHLAPFYIPLYLHGVLGIPWSQLGWMFAIMLLPFVLIEYPAGYLADKWIGEKELLIAGFVLTALGTAALAFTTSTTPLLLILATLVVMRFGNALVEAMSDGHFFKRVSTEDANTVTLYRMTRPVAALIAPLSASLVLLVSGSSYTLLFGATAALVLVMGVGSAYFIKDDR